MAWRIDESVIRGEIENHTRGRVTGRIWFVDRDEPVELELAGNAWRDLAGRRLEFVNPAPKPGALESVATRQTGVIGDCTASRKVKVPDVSMEEFRELYRQRKPFPWHWGNSLYLEWFSTKNGRVVIESADYQLTIAPEITWEMSEAEEESQRRANAEAMENFMGRLGAAAAAESNAPSPSESTADDAWTKDQPLTEAEAEKMQEDSDRLADRIQARIDREGPDADFQHILEEELERRARERGDKPLTPEEEAARARWVEEMNRAAEEALANPDPEFEAELNAKHPLAEQAFDLALRLMHEPEKRGWIARDASEEHPLIDLATTSSKAGAKLAGALNGHTWPPEVEDCAATIVRLKRAHGYLDDALLAAESCGQQGLGDTAWLAGVQRELNAVAHECDALIGELRAKLERGFD